MIGIWRKPLFSLREHTLFVIKNGLSALLMREIWRESGLPKFYYFFDDVAAHGAAVANVLAPISADCVRIDNQSDVFFRRRLWRRYTLVHTLSNAAPDRLAKALPRGTPRYVVQHGSVEMEAYLSTAAGEKTSAAGFFLLCPETMRRLALRNGGNPLPCRGYPLPRNSFQLRRGISLFAMQPLLDSGVMTEETFDMAVKEFLQGRPPMKYMIAPHPRNSSKTVARLRRHFEAFGIEYDQLSISDRCLEEYFPEIGCEEISTFYSTAALACRELYGVPAVSMARQLSELPFLKSHQLRLVRMLSQIL